MRDGRLLRLEFLLFAGGVLFISYFFLSWLDRTYSQRRLEEMFEAGKTEEIVVRPAHGEIVGKIEIPSVGISAVILEGADEESLRHAVGHIPGTALPGQRGRVALAAHRDSFFRPLAEIRLRDRILLETPTETFEYQVRKTEIVRPEETDTIAPTRDATLTLITCYPFHYIGSAPLRFVVHARRVSATTPSG